MKANSSARAVNKFRLASTITAIQTVRTVVAPAIIAIEMEPLVQTIMSHQECNSNSSSILLPVLLPVCFFIPQILSQYNNSLEFIHIVKIII